MTKTTTAPAHTLSDAELRDELNRLRARYLHATAGEQAELDPRLTELAIVARARYGII